MARRLVGVLFALALSTACAEPPLTAKPLAITEPVPEWLADLISTFENPPVTNPPPFVARYDYHDQVVYYVAPRCCDIYSVLYDSAGAVLCAPDGGLTGTGDGRCPDFIAERRNEVILWQPQGES